MDDTKSDRPGESMKRTVILTVDDEEAEVVLHRAMTAWQAREFRLHVEDETPIDDQLTRDLDSLTAFVQGALDSMIQVGGDSKGMVDYADMAARIRAAAGLDDTT